MGRRFWALAFVLGAFGLTGCSSGTGGDVSGTVKFGGMPATSGTVVIENEKGRSAVGVINRDGTYTVAAPPLGKCKVMLPPLSARARRRPA